MCFIQCPPGKTLSTIPDKKPMKNAYYCMEGSWYHQMPTDVVERIPDCVGEDLHFVAFIQAKKNNKNNIHTKGFICIRIYIALFFSKHYLPL